MTLPTFLGIGVQRGGSTWLHTLLAGHPDVYMPTRRKEIRFLTDIMRMAWVGTRAFFVHRKIPTNIKPSAKFHQNTMNVKSVLSEFTIRFLKSKW